MRECVCACVCVFYFDANILNIDVMNDKDDMIKISIGEIIHEISPRCGYDLLELYSY